LCNEGPPNCGWINYLNYKGWEFGGSEVWLLDLVRPCILFFFNGKLLLVFSGWLLRYSEGGLVMVLEGWIYAGFEQN
jgi:hypothetical protein